MPIKGITVDEESIIQTILTPYKNKYDFFYYGSRVKGNYRPLSDLDIMIKGDKEADINDINTIKTNFDNSNLPFIVNISDFYNLEEYFYKLIEQDLVKA